jgi:phytoene desaturase
VQALVRLFRELGGEIRLESEVAEIITRGNEVAGVITKDGQEKGFDLVVSNADVFHTMRCCGGTRVEEMRQNQRKVGMSVSGYLKPRSSIRVAHPTSCSVRYRELLRDIFEQVVWRTIFRYLHAPARSILPWPRQLRRVLCLSPVPHLARPD